MNEILKNILQIICWNYSSNAMLKIKRNSAQFTHCACLFKLLLCFLFPLSTFLILIFSPLSRRFLLLFHTYFMILRYFVVASLSSQISNLNSITFAALAFLDCLGRNQRENLNDVYGQGGQHDVEEDKAQSLSRCDIGAQGNAYQYIKVRACHDHIEHINCLLNQ
ncbi:hypothetical protein FGO68_gene1605 [Halteria grandinella]|uniref:Uncharacterized protein n=1 Tax=Halteria grandinella TaxID=5974 RepID=A0A8J8P352_HALGN|nr:hypothetical protein FGO68_gene1605 [Halteria grandinella]